jgi:hypothetical protein
LNKLVQWNPDDLPEEANAFFDLFIEDANKQLIDVPVLIRNYRGTGGKIPNVGTEIVDTWKFTRRFFVYDTISGID